MKEFVALRAKAREKRDKAMAKARAEYEETMTRIAALEQDLLGKELSRYGKISVCVDQVIPADREFTTKDVMTALEALDPTRLWRKRSVDYRITALCRRGIIRRLRRPRNNAPAVYARASVEVAERPFQGMTLRDAIAATLGRNQMNDTELAVAMLEAGYDTAMSARALREEIACQLREGKGLFVKVDTKWGLADP